MVTENQQQASCLIMQGHVLLPVAQHRKPPMHLAPHFPTPSAGRSHNQSHLYGERSISPVPNILGCGWLNTGTVPSHFSHTIGGPLPHRFTPERRAQHLARYARHHAAAHKAEALDRLRNQRSCPRVHAVQESHVEVGGGTGDGGHGVVHSDEAREHADLGVLLAVAHHTLH